MCKDCGYHGHLSRNARPSRMPEPRGILLCGICDEPLSLHTLDTHREALGKLVVARLQRGLSDVADVVMETPALRRGVPPRAAGGGYVRRSVTVETCPTYLWRGCGA